MYPACMGKVISLSSIKKERARAARKRQGDANSARFGQTLAERRAEAAERDRARRELDGKKKD